MIGDAGHEGLSLTMRAIAEDGLPGWYPSPETTTRVTELTLVGTALNEPVTATLDEPACNVADVGERVIPAPMSAHEIETVNAADASPVRVRMNPGGVTTNGVKSAEQPPTAMTPFCVTAMVTDGGACWAVTGAVRSNHAPRKTPRNTTRRIRMTRRYLGATNMNDYAPPAGTDSSRQFWRPQSEISMRLWVPSGSAVCRSHGRGTMGTTCSRSAQDVGNGQPGTSGRSLHARCALTS